MMSARKEEFLSIEILCLLIFFLIHITHAKDIFVSTTGSDASDGLSPDQALAKISIALEMAEPGDQILLMPGTYKGDNNILHKHGYPDLPITIMSYANDSSQYAMIDGDAEPSGDDHNAFFIMNSSWITIKNLKIRNCWRYVFPIQSSNYISIIGCHIAGGQYAVFPLEKDCHHFLVEYCYWEQDPLIYTDYNWEQMHHGSMDYFNGSLFAGVRIGGGVVLRHNIIKDVYNGIRFVGSNDDLRLNANIEIYDNYIINTGDNALEPEKSCFNLHMYHNRLENSHAFISIDMLRGGPIYFYGNVGWQSMKEGHEWTIFKFRGYEPNSPPALLDAPFYVFNNSWYVHFDAVAGSDSQWKNRYMKHFNNAYYFLNGQNLGVENWGEGYEFDYDCSNTDFPGSIKTHGGEGSGIVADPQFIDKENGDFHLQLNSPCIDKGVVMNFPEFGWQQKYDDEGVDIGAYEGNQLVEGPPFRFIDPPAGAYYEEKPRIVRHRVEDNRLYLYFSVNLEPTSVSLQSVKIYSDGIEINILNTFLDNANYRMVIETDHSMNPDSLALSFIQMPLGANGETATMWASTLPDFKSPETQFPERLELYQNYPNPFNTKTTIEYELPRNGYVEVKISDILGRQVRTLVAGDKMAGYHRVIWNGLDDGGNRVASGVYLYRMTAEGFTETRKLLLIR